jgi:sugar phosphate isomerase/epimerase
MRLLFLCPRWGSEALELPRFLDRARDAGYDGVELSLPPEPAQRERARGQIEERGLALVAQHHETLAPDFAAHRDALEARLRGLAAARPLLVNSQTGRDHFSFAQNVELLELAAAVARETGVPIVHETHRGRFSFAAHVARGYLEALPWLRLGLDLSHWCAVAESYLEDQPEAVALALARADHLHARVGSPEGPQVADWRAADAAEALARHLAWWDRVVERRRSEGAASLTVTPEFGPRPYMIHLPGTGEPIADQWELNRAMMELLRARYARPA